MAMYCYQPSMNETFTSFTKTVYYNLYVRYYFIIIVFYHYFISLFILIIFWNIVSVINIK